MPIKKLTLLISLLVAGIIVSAIAFTQWAKANRATLHDVKIGLPTWRIRIANAFSYDKQGHFGSQTQYLSKHADSENGNYCVQCNKGKVIAVFVKYTPPISREQSMRVITRLVDNEKITERDASELSQHNSTDPSQHDKVAPQAPGAKPDPFYCPPSEYVYFNHGKAAELLFVGPKDDRVTDLMVWG